MVRIGGPTAGEDNSHSISGANRRMNCVQQAGIMPLGGDRLVGFLKELSRFRRYMRASRRATATVLPLGIGGSCLSADGKEHAFFADLPPKLPPPAAGSEEILNRTFVHGEVEPGTKSLMNGVCDIREDPFEFLLRRWLGDNSDIDITRFSDRGSPCKAAE
jgi:hypothetical protein